MKFIGVQKCPQIDFLKKHDVVVRSFDGPGNTRRGEKAMKRLLLGRMVDWLAGCPVTGEPSESVPKGWFTSAKVKDVGIKSLCESDLNFLIRCRFRWKRRSGSKVE